MTLNEYGAADNAKSEMAYVMTYQTVVTLTCRILSMKFKEAQATTQKTRWQL